ncbi:hypothetical protein Gohar_018650 [Gossypium harknessii]|uniref:RING-type E3 ubiquitin transferase n=1 Tax=Gossypium harknessii TaxID=34285 RepID=A0A7J9GB11_9ROSI|nr:hypothetical protein [Gossypium harknessii]
MDPLNFFFIVVVLILLSFFQPFLTNGELCSAVSCSNVIVEYPFRLTNQPDCCGHPDFNLSISCRSRYHLPDQTIISHLPVTSGSKPSIIPLPTYCSLILAFPNAFLRDSISPSPLYDHRHQPNAEISSLTEEQQLADITVNGLDGSRIEAYPITLLGENFELPRPNDNTCSICLSEYQAKETIRTIPDCKHYFHANCIDEWFKLNAACPVCRNTPDHDSARLNTRSTSAFSSRPPL